MHRAPRVTITVRQVVTTTNDGGDSSSTDSTTTVPGCIFEPAQPVERTDPRSPGVSVPAKFYVPAALSLNADDEVTADGVTWAVIGGSSVWGDRTEIPVQRTGAA